MNELERLADLIHKRNQISQEISKIIGRPALQQHIGEYIASRIFKIRLEESATAKGIDGVFQEGPLEGRTVNIKMYGKQEGLLDISLKNLADYYLVLTGPKGEATSSRGKMRPTQISNVYLFKMEALLKKLVDRKVKIGTATSVTRHFWEESEIFPCLMNRTLQLSKDQIKQIELFSARAGEFNN